MPILQAAGMDQHAFITAFNAALGDETEIATLASSLRNTGLKNKAEDPHEKNHGSEQSNPFKKRHHKVPLPPSLEGFTPNLANIPPLFFEKAMTEHFGLNASPINPQQTEPHQQ